MERHQTGCAECAQLMADLDGIVQGAAALPVLTPSRDLWRGIEAKLAAPVIPLGARRDELRADAGAETGAVAGLSPVRQRSVSVQWFAVAATMLVAVSSALTWTVARASFDNQSTPASVAATDAPRTTPAASPVGSEAGAPVSSPSSGPEAVLPGATLASGAPAGQQDNGATTASRASNDDRGDAGGTSGVTLRAASMTDVDVIYEREIAALRRIVDERFAELDTATVTELRNNIRTIDRAIEDSRRALARDPRSRVLSSELDRTLEAKLSLMRRVALL